MAFEFLPPRSTWSEVAGQFRLTLKRAHLAPGDYGAAGAIESIATVLQLNGGFLHPSANCGDLHPEIEDIVGRVPMRTVPCQFNIALKTSFGFGDVNACLIFRRYEATH